MLRFCILVSFLAIGIGERYVALQDIFADYGVAAYALPRVKPRATGGPLYESFGIPWRFDVSNGQGDCSFGAALAAVANLSPDWITSRINITAGTLDDATSVTVQLYDLNTSVPVIVKAEWETYATKGGDYHYDAWWPAAYEQAAVQAIGYQLPGIGAMEVLKVITGMEFDTLDGDARTKDAVFSKFGEVQASNTPVIFNTPSDPTVLVGEHAYPVLNTSIDNGVRMVGIHEIDLAGDQYFPLDTIWHDIVGLVFLKGLPSLPQATPEQLATLAQYNADPPRFPFVMVEDDGSGKATGTTWVTPPFPTYSPSSTLTSPVSNAASPTATTTTPSTPVTPSAVSSAENLLATSPASADNVVWVTEVVTVTV